MFIVFNNPPHPNRLINLDYPNHSVVFHLPINAVIHKKLRHECSEKRDHNAETESAARPIEEPPEADRHGGQGER